MESSSHVYSPPLNAVILLCDTWMDLSLTCNRHNPILTPWVVSPRCSRKLVWTDLTSFSSILSSCPVFWFTLLCSLLPNSHLKTKIYSFLFSCVLICVVPSWLDQREDDYTKRRLLCQGGDGCTSTKMSLPVSRLAAQLFSSSADTTKIPPSKIEKVKWNLLNVAD